MKAECQISCNSNEKQAISLWLLALIEIDGLQHFPKTWKGKGGDYFQVVINDEGKWANPENIELYATLEAGVVKVQFPVLTLREITAKAEDDSDVVNIFHITNQPQISAKHIFLE